ncbi:SDR family NAD(P)-dependent oxidoreductase [Nocardia sp. NPDC051570]|uniref:SDR family NAD(P)-dependent oxidoreductase n=1 Tax=Nocardia sp. NPDC051570 TaxID=3364324 RepID=UPI0037A002BF
MGVPDQTPNVLIVGDPAGPAGAVARAVAASGARTVIGGETDRAEVDAVVRVATALADFDAERIRRIGAPAVVTVLVSETPADDETIRALADIARRSVPPGDAAVRADAVHGRADAVEAVSEVVVLLLRDNASRTGRIVTVAELDRTVTRTPDTDAIVVVGMGMAVPGASSPEQFWQLLRADEPVFREPGDRYDLATMWSEDPSAEDRTYSRVAGFMHGFEPHPRLRAEMDSGAFTTDEYTAVWLRHSLLQAIEGVTLRAEDRRLFSVGMTPDGSQHLEQSLVAAGIRGIFARHGTPVPDGLDALYPLAADAPEDLLPHRIARMAAHDLPDSSEIVVVDTACSSSLYAIDLGVRALRAGEADVALCGGALALQAQSLVLFSKLRGLSRSGSVRALDGAADGVLFSDGAAVLALKTHARAVADNDPILGFVAGFGGSSDGRGKAIYAPNAAGQRIALERGWSAAGVTAADIDWIVAHATGTPTGDKTEMTALEQHGGPGKTWTMTSNKSLVGHSGWAAGAVSAIHALLALRHESIPAQRRFSRVPAGFEESIHVPTTDTPWPAGSDRRRIVGVSAMGFGGTNGHLLLSDRPGPRPDATPVEPEDPVVVVAHGVHMPGEPGAEQIRRWLVDGTADWPATFGDDYPLPSPVEARLAPSALAAMDRGQLMAMRCGDQLAGEWTRDERLAERTGVFVGHTGPTRSAMGYDLRCYLDDATAKLTGPAGMPPSLLGAAVRAMVPASNEDSYPGLMPNVIAARVVQRLNLHGPNMTVDAGADSVTSATAVALRYLRDGELDLAVVIGVNTVTPYLDRPGPHGAEAAIGFLLTRHSIARRLGMPVLGTVELGTNSSARQAVYDTDRDYGGAQAAVAVLRALHAPGTRTVITGTVDRHTPSLVVTAEPTGDAYPALRQTSQRHTLKLVSRPGERIRDPLLAIPANSLVLTDDPGALSAVTLPPGCLIIAPESARTGGGEGPATYLADAEALARVVADDGRGFAHVRVLVGSQRWNAEPAVPQQVLDLDDIAFAAAQRCADSLEQGGSYAVLLLDAIDGTVPLPYVGVFNGVVRSLQQELPGCLVFSLATDRNRLADGLVQLAEESAHHRHLPVAYLSAGQRWELMLVATEAPTADTPLGLPEAPVIVATGGARGLTAHLVHEVVTGAAPRGVWLLGTAPAPDLSISLTPRPREDALRELMARHPGEKLAQLNRRYERELHEIERVRTIGELERLCGPGRVRYRQCDVLDAEAVRRVIDEVLSTDGSVDVVLHGAGLARTAMLGRKKLADFRMVRDVKVRGYANLRSALADREPAVWASVSSVSAFTPLRGEFDYCAGNEFLLLAAAHSRKVFGRDEVALASGLWVESGMASADTPGGAFLARQSEIGQLTDIQGREFFRAELSGRGGPGLATTWIGEFDWATLERRAPGYRAACKEPADDTAGVPDRYVRPVERRAFLAGPPLRRNGSGDDELVWTFDVGLDRHPYLLDHLVDGRPTVPGAVILEIAAEAAAELVPGLIPIRISDVVLSGFIRASRHRWPRTLRAVATHGADEQVWVRILTPAAGPVPEREHARMVVHLGRALPTGPWCPPVPAEGTPAPDTYAIEGTPVRLSGVFSALREPRLVADGGAAQLNPRVRTTDGPFASFVLPSIVLDCVLRTSVLDGHRPDVVSALVPTALASVDLYSLVNDVELSETWPDGLVLRHWHDPVSGLRHCAVVTPAGRALLRVTGVDGVDKDLYDLRTGRWRKAAAVPGPK